MFSNKQNFTINDYLNGMDNKKRVRHFIMLILLPVKHIKRISWKTK